MADTLNQYKSTLTPQQVDDALRKIAEGNTVSPQDLLTMIYPVGSIYISANNVSPQTFLGGTWAQLQGQFLLAASGTYPAGSTGGAAQVTLQAANMPTMVGYLNSGFTVDWGNPNMPVLFKAGDAPVLADTGTVQGNQVGAYQNDRSVNIPGTNTPLSVMPPYLAVYMWKRIA